MSYIENSLAKDEKILKEIKLHWINYISCICWFIFWSYVFIWVSLANGKGEDILQFLVGLCLFYEVYMFFRLYLTERVMTNKRVVYKEGIISRYTEELKDNRIESIEVKQSIFGRLFDYGDVVFSGIGASKVIFKAVDDPITVKREVDEILYKMKE